MTYIDPNAEESQVEKLLFRAPQLGNRFNIIGLIGQGAAGTVWSVVDRTLQKQFAVKVLRPEFSQNSLVIATFANESLLAPQLTHPNIVSVYGSGTDEAGNPYIIMDYVQGDSLQKILATEGKMDYERVTNIFTQLCDALSHSHLNGIIHRDIKPSNIIVSKTESGGEIAQILDFGIAKSLYGETRSNLTFAAGGKLLGSLAYMSSEQCLGLQPSAQSDIYALGCILYEMLTGKPPFIERQELNVIARHLIEEPDLSIVPSAFRELLRVRLFKDPMLRPHNVDELLKIKLLPPRRFSAGPTSFWINVSAIFPGFVALTCAAHLIDVAPGLYFDVIFSFFIILLFPWATLAFANNTSIVRSQYLRTLEYSFLMGLILLPVELLIQTFFHVRLYMDLAFAFSAIHAFFVLRLKSSSNSRYARFLLGSK